MDPNANLEEQRRIAIHIIEAIDAGQVPQEADVDRLAELVLALDGWLRSGGFLPASWARRGADKQLNDRIDHLDKIVAELIADTARHEEQLAQPDWRERR
jgi:hypothetical protein